MIRSCDYCLSVFDDTYWSWCVFCNQDDDSSVCLCSICASEILFHP